METYTSNIILKATDLSIGYKQKNSKVIIASNIQLEINQNELVAVIGVNGIGKSTLLRSISGIQPLLHGEVSINNTLVKNINAQEQASLISLVLTEQPVSKNLSVFELVALGRQPYTNWIGKLTIDDLKQILTAINLVGIRDLIHKKCFELSDGQMQKALVARALAQNTPLVILDEPTTHLDMYHKAYVLKMLKNLTRKTQKAIVFASHEINLAIQLCDKIILLTKDKVQIGTPLELINSGAFTEIFPSDLISFDAESSSFKINAS